MRQPYLTFYKLTINFSEASIYNLLGEQVVVLFDQVKEVGYHNVTWNASSLASGIYIYTIEAKSLDGLKNFNSVKKMTLIK